MWKFIIKPKCKDICKFTVKLEPKDFNFYYKTYFECVILYILEVKVMF